MRRSLSTLNADTACNELSCRSSRRKYLGQKDGVSSWVCMLHLCDAIRCLHNLRKHLPQSQPDKLRSLKLWRDGEMTDDTSRSARAAKQVYSGGTSSQFNSWSSAVPLQNSWTHKTLPREVTRSYRQMRATIWQLTSSLWNYRSKACVSVGVFT